jgi:hypothetical protein
VQKKQEKLTLENPNQATQPPIPTTQQAEDSPLRPTATLSYNKHAIPKKQNKQPHQIAATKNPSAPKHNTNLQYKITNLIILKLKIISNYLIHLRFSLVFSFF